MPVVVLLVLVVLGVGGPFVYLHLLAKSYPPPFALPAAAGPSPGTAPLDGTWRVAPDSQAGYRAREEVLLQGHDIAGRTGTVSGSVVVQGSAITSGRFTVGVTDLQANGRPQPGLSSVIDTAAHPDVTLTLDGPLPLVGLAAGTLAGSTPGRLSVNGVTRPVTFTFAARRQADTVQVAGSAPVELRDWQLTPPRWALIARLGDTATAEFLITLQR